jgi:predicted MPP superfamily phosphohydrolase
MELHRPPRPNRPIPRVEVFIAKVVERLLEPGLITRWIYRIGLQGRLQVSEHELTLGPECSLPRPLRIAFISDLHAGRTTHPELFSRVSEQLELLAPDVLLLGGDYVGTRATSIHELIESDLLRWRAPLGNYAVLGNHDHWTDADYIRRQLEAAGIEVLVNRNARLPPPFADVSVCGIDDPWSGERNAASAFENSGPVRIFLSHSPDGLLLLGGQRFDVCFAGHTHGGQVTFANEVPIICAGGPLVRIYSRGRFEIPDNGTLFVSRGVGCSTLPIRINSDPELILCTVLPGTR